MELILWRPLPSLLRITQSLRLLIRKIGWGGERGRAGHPGHCQSDELLQNDEGPSQWVVVRPPL